MDGNYRRTLIRLFTFLGGIIFFLEFILPESVLKSVNYTNDIHEQISNGFIVFGAMAVGLGLINLFMVYGSRVIFRRKDWFYGLVLLVGLVLMMTVTSIDWVTSLKVSKRVQNISILSDFALQIVKDYEAGKEGVPPLSFRNQKLKEAVQDELTQLETLSEMMAERFPGEQEIDQYRVELGSAVEATQGVLGGVMVVDGVGFDLTGNKELSQSLDKLRVTKQNLLMFEYRDSTIKQVYDFLFWGLFVSLGSAMFSLLGVYIASAAYRAFRIRSLESSFMMVTALIVMLGQIPFGLWISPELPTLRLWLLEIPNSAVFRAIRIGAAVAGLVMAFRMWLSIESESFSDS